MFKKITILLFAFLMLTACGYKITIESTTDEKKDMETKNIEENTDIYCYEEEGFEPVESSFVKSKKDGIYYSFAVLPNENSVFKDVNQDLAEEINDYLNEEYDVPFCNQSNNYSAIKLDLLELKTPEEARKELEEFRDSDLESVLEEYKEEAEMQAQVEFKTTGGYTMFEYNGLDAGCTSYIVTSKFVISLSTFPGSCNDSEIYAYVMNYFENEFADFATKHNIQPHTEETMEIAVYFSDTKDNKDLVNCRKTRAVTRDIPKTKAVAQTAIEQLFIGPTEEEIEDGLYPFNRDKKEMSDVIKRIFVVEDTIYIDWYDFSQKSPLSNDKPFFYNSSSGGCNVTPPLEDTLLAFPNINNIVYAFEGDPAKYYNWNQIGCDPEYNENKCDPTPFQ